MPARYSYAWRRSRTEDLIRACYACEWCHKEDQPLGPGYSDLERAHLDGDRSNDHPDNRAVVCRKCHRGHDFPEVARKMREKRVAKKDAARPILVYLQEEERQSA